VGWDWRIGDRRFVKKISELDKYLSMSRGKPIILSRSTFRQKDGYIKIREESSLKRRSTLTTSLKWNKPFYETEFWTRLPPHGSNMAYP